MIFGVCVGRASLSRVITELARIGRAALIFLIIPTSPLVRANRNDLLIDSPSPYGADVANGFRYIDIIILT